MTNDSNTWVSLLETILQIQDSAAASRQQSQRHTVELTDEDETVFVSFIPAPNPAKM